MMQRAILRHAVRVEFSLDVPPAAQATIWVIRQKKYVYDALHEKGP